LCLETQNQVAVEAKRDIKNPLAPLLLHNVQRLPGAADQCKTQPNIATGEILWIVALEEMS